ncbi:MAG: AAA family ATPase [Lachnospira eligens]
MCRVIAVSNQKGGVGKTVSCVNLGIGLAQEGKKVLLIDADPQGSLTISMGYEEPDEMEYSLATMMMKLNIKTAIMLGCKNVFIKEPVYVVDRKVQKVHFTKSEILLISKTGDTCSIRNIIVNILTKWHWWETSLFYRIFNINCKKLQKRI